VSGEARRREPEERRIWMPKNHIKLHKPIPKGFPKFASGS